ncbi:MAG: hypothetical protein H0X29_08785 [Parachlamydiaceae bacterium]|nr:hypothetical protein [Parachlamydiaceae bacterium]
MIVNTMKSFGIQETANLDVQDIRDTSLPQQIWDQRPKNTSTDDLLPKHFERITDKSLEHLPIESPNHSPAELNHINKKLDLGLSIVKILALLTGTLLFAKENGFDVTNIFKNSNNIIRAGITEAITSFPIDLSCIDQLNAKSMEYNYIKKFNNYTQELSGIPETFFCGDTFPIDINVNEPKETKSLSYLNCSLENPKYLVINPRGGLGNRVGSIASAYAVARFTGRTLVLDWKFKNEGHDDRSDQMEMSAHFNDLFDNYIIPSDKFLSMRTHSFWSGYNIKIMNMRDFLSSPEVLTERIMTSNEEVIYLHTVVKDFTGHFLDNSNFSIESKDSILKSYLECLRNLHPNKLVTQKVDEYANKHFSNQFVNDKIQMIGVHYRSYSEEVGDKYFRGYSQFSKYSLFDDLVDRMNKVDNINKLKGITTKFFLATDTAKVINEFKKQVKAEVLTYDHKEHGISRNDLSSQLGGLIDFFLLSHTNKIIGASQSTFSELSALLTTEGIKESIGPNVFGSPKIYSTVTTSNFYQSWLSRNPHESNDKKLL